MGLGFVLLFWTIAGVVLAGAGLVVLGFSAAYLLRGVPARRNAVAAAAFYPFACLAWAAIVFAFQALVNGALLGRDPGMGDLWHCPTPSGYQIVMVDVTTSGGLYSPVPRAGGDPGAPKVALSGVRTLQVSGPYILGGIDARLTERQGDGTGKVDAYFLVDTRTGAVTGLHDAEKLREASLKLGIAPRLEPIADVYSRYRFTWFDTVSGLLFCLPPVVGFALLARWILRLRKGRPPAPAPVPAV
jgi:hypothetical protein